MKKVYLFVGIAVLLTVIFLFYSAKTKDKAALTDTDTGLTSPPIEESPINTTPFITGEIKYYDTTDSEARKAIDKRMAVLHATKWKDILKEANISDIFKDLKAVFKGFISSNLSKIGYSEIYLKLGYSDDYFARLKQFEGLRSITEESKDWQLQENTINDFLVNRSDLSSVGGTDFRGDTFAMRGVTDGMGGDRWGVYENWRILGVNLKNESLKYKQALEERATQDLIKGGWHFYGY
jgi:hypothetical protein